MGGVDFCVVALSLAIALVAVLAPSSISDTACPRGRSRTAIGSMVMIGGSPTSPGADSCSRGTISAWKRAFSGRRSAFRGVFRVARLGADDHRIEGGVKPP